MISRRQIQRLIEANAFPRLVERILINGRCRDRAARALLRRPEAAAPAGLGLALQRLSELSYGSCAVSSAAAARLMLLQRRDGLFVGPNSVAPPSAAASAVATSGLIAWRQLRADTGADPDARLEATIARGIRALADMLQRELGRLEASEVDLIVWQLGREPAFRSALPLDLRSALLGNTTAPVRPGELARFARAAAA